MGILTALIGPAFHLVKGWLDGKQQNQQQKQALAAAKAQALIQHVNNLDAATSAWNLKAMDHSGWRADYMTIILSLPLIAIFIPPAVPYIKDGFIALASLPKWYTGAVGVMVASAFGYQKFADMSIRRNAMKIVHTTLTAAQQPNAASPDATPAQAPGRPSDADSTGDDGIVSAG